MTWRPLPRACVLFRGAVKFAGQRGGDVAFPLIAARLELSQAARRSRRVKYSAHGLASGSAVNKGCSVSATGGSIIYAFHRLANSPPRPPLPLSLPHRLPRASSRPLDQRVDARRGRRLAAPTDIIKASARAWLVAVLFGARQVSASYERKQPTLSRRQCRGLSGGRSRV